MTNHLYKHDRCQLHSASEKLFSSLCKQAATVLLTLTVAALSSAAPAVGLDPALGILPNIQTATVYDDVSTDTKQYIPRIIHQVSWFVPSLHPVPL